MNKLTTFVVTGASGGIGKALTMHLLKQYAEAYFVLMQRCGPPQELCDRVLTVEMDFANPKTEEMIPDECRQKILCADEVFLILCSGMIEPIGKVGELHAQVLQDSVFVNVLASAKLINEVLGMAAGKLKVIQLDSGAAYRPIDGWAAYCAAKAYLSMYLRVVKEEGKAQVVCFDPGVVDTQMQAQIRGASREQCKDVQRFKEYHALGQLRLPQDVAEQITDRYILQWSAEGLCERIR